jgi:LDH2 family malate/lactate/ureidoglycolate dehydrogenase
LLRKKGWKAMAVVAGEEADPRLIEKAAQAGVAVLEDGRQFNWEQALAKA